MRFLSGPKAGQAVALTREQTVVGRAGVQVAVIERLGEGYRFKPVEGDPPPVNGRPASSDGVVLAPGDVIEMLGVRLEFVLGGAPGASSS